MEYHVDFSRDYAEDVEREWNTMDDDLEKVGFLGLFLAVSLMFVVE